MGLLDALFGKVEHEEESTPDLPASVEVGETAGVVYAPCTGELIPMERIPDPVFASGAMGPAVGIKPAHNVLYAPVTGEITVLPNTLHAIGLHSDEGIDVLIHAGVDTVNLRGACFSGFVHNGQHVKAGEPLMTMDLGQIETAGYSDVVIVVVLNAADFASVIPTVQTEVVAGRELLTTAS